MGLPSRGNPGTDPARAQFAANLEWVASQGITVERYNPQDHPEAFSGEACLPLIVIDGSIASCSGYLSRQELAALAGLVTIPRVDSDRPGRHFVLSGASAADETAGAACKRAAKAAREAPAL